MKARGYALLVSVALCGLVVSSQKSLAQPVPAPPSPSANRARPVPPLPGLPPMRSPVAAFRELLAVGPVEREPYLSERKPEQRKVLEAKLKEYEALSPNERELRLKTTELRWYLLSLIHLPPSNRIERLLGLPDTDRKLIEQRLDAWDRLSKETQREILENELAIRYFAQLNAASAAQREALLAELPPVQRQKIEADIVRWRALPEDQRERMHEHFRQFFELTEKEREKVLSSFSETERQQMERTLQAFEKLPRPLRERCIAAFHKFANMTLEQRLQFLKSAERWQDMTAEERQRWRDIVSKLPRTPVLPPYPPFLIPGPPRPPGTVTEPAALATNRTR